MKGPGIIGAITDREKAGESQLRLEDGARVAVIGGGPAGSFFSYFVLEFAARIHLDIEVNIYEPREFSRPSPQGCNMCGGIISESLVQYLAAEGINLPTTVVQRGIDSYTMHMDVGSSRIATPRQEKRIAAVHRGAGPRTIHEAKWNSFDGYLLSLAVEKGARVIPKRVSGLVRAEGKPRIQVPGLELEAYDLVVVATGVNAKVLLSNEGGLSRHQPPRTTKTAIREYYLGMDTINRYMGSSMHVFLLDLPRLEFAALIPKGDFVTVCLLGEAIDNELLQSFLNTPEVKACFPPGWRWDDTSCMCMPRMYVHGAPKPYGDRIVFVGDCGVSRLYKDGIGAAYRTAKAAARTVVFRGISSDDFAGHFRPACRAIEGDNGVGRLIFIVVRMIQRFRFARRGVLRMISREQTDPDSRRRMSGVLWDTFTGSAPYRDVFLRTLHPAFLGSFLWNIALALVAVSAPVPAERLREDADLDKRM
jgi:flavin-dependent dehydrogenase